MGATQSRRLRLTLADSNLLLALTASDVDAWGEQLLVESLDFAELLVGHGPPPGKHHGIAFRAGLRPSIDPADELSAIRFVLFEPG